MAVKFGSVLGSFILGSEVFETDGILSRMKKGIEKESNKLFKRHSIVYERVWIRI